MKKVLDEGATLVIGSIAHDLAHGLINREGISRELPPFLLQRALFSFQGGGKGA